MQCALAAFDGILGCIGSDPPVHRLCLCCCTEAPAQSSVIRCMRLRALRSPAQHTLPRQRLRCDGVRLGPLEPCQCER